MSKTLSYAQWSLEPYCIGMKLRALRTQKRLTLSRLAAETGLSTALLSKLETDRMTPTLPTLATICRVYGVGMSHFFHEPDHHVLSITRKAHLEGTARGAELLKAVPLHFPGKSPRMVAQMIEVPSGGGDAFPEHYEGQVNGIVFVIEGAVRLNAGGLVETLETGDCAYVDTVMPLGWSALGEQRCRILAVSPVKDSQYRGRSPETS
jgi:transcriptional regulator with XRE-family HTH domain